MTDLFRDTGAAFSPCGTYRYRLWRVWDSDKPLLVMVMLNPSTADDVKNDATITRCERRAEQQGYGALTVLNIFAYRATDPEVMKAAVDPVGPDNDDHIRQALNEARTRGDMICAGWGEHGSHRGRDREILALAEMYGVQLHCLKVIKGGAPGHPLYIGYDKPFIPWSLRR